MAGATDFVAGLVTLASGPCGRKVDGPGGPEWDRCGGTVSLFFVCRFRSVYTCLLYDITYYIVYVYSN